MTGTYAGPVEHLRATYFCRIDTLGWLHIHAPEPMAWLIATDGLGRVQWWPESQ